MYRFMFVIDDHHWWCDKVIFWFFRLDLRRAELETQCEVSGQQKLRIVCGDILLMLSFHVIFLNTFTFRCCLLDIWLWKVKYLKINVAFSKICAVNLVLKIYHEALPCGFDAAAELLYEKWPWLMEDLKPCHLFVSLILFVWLVV